MENLPGPLLCLRGEFRSLPDPFERLVRRSGSLEGIATGLHCSVDEFRTILDELRTTLDKHQTSADRHWIIVDGQVIRWHEFQGAVNISMNFVDESGITLHVWKGSLYQ